MLQYSQLRLLCTLSQLLLQGLAILDLSVIHLFLIYNFPTYFIFPAIVIPPPLAYPLIVGVFETIGYVLTQCYVISKVEICDNHRPNPPTSPSFYLEEDDEDVPPSRSTPVRISERYISSSGIITFPFVLLYILHLRVGQG